MKIKLEDLIPLIDVLTVVEIIKTGDRTIFKGRLKDLKPQEIMELSAYRIIPCATARETYLEIGVY